jgi:tetratricopeptide (TPR) repeat protein
VRGYVIILLVAGAITHGAERYLDTLGISTTSRLRETLPSEEALQLLSLTYKPLVADYYWLRSLNEFGNTRLQHAGLPNLEALVRRVIALDPYFETAYFFAGTALTVRGLDPHAAIELLERGLVYRPDSWRVAFLLGFNAYYFAGDYEKAAHAMARAAALPKAPPVAGPLATRLAAEAGKPEIGIRMIDSLLEGITDDKLRVTYIERRKLLVVELHLRWLQEAVDHYLTTKGQCPASLDALLASGQLREIPKEPLGGTYSLGADCRVQSSSNRERLRLHGIKR